MVTPQDASSPVLFGGTRLRPRTPQPASLSCLSDRLGWVVLGARGGGSRIYGDQPGRRWCSDFPTTEITFGTTVIGAILTGRRAFWSLASGRAWWPVI